MELIIKEMELPAAIEFNFEELKQELAEVLSFYDGLVYTPDQLKEAKSDRAKLNKLKKALNDERIRREREYMKPFNDFKAKVSEIIAMIDQPVAVIDEQVKAFEQAQKEQKRREIEKAFFYAKVDEEFGLDNLDAIDFLTLEQIFDTKWLNSSVSIESIAEEIKSKIRRILIDLQTLSGLPEFGFEARQVYVRTLDLTQAIAEGKQIADIQKEKEAQTVEAVVPEPVKEEPEEQEDFLPAFDSTEPIWRSYRIKLTTDQKQILEQFLISSGIMFQEGEI